MQLQAGTGGVERTGGGEHGRPPAFQTKGRPVEDDQKRLDKAIEKVREWAKREPNCEITLTVRIEQGRITSLVKELRD